MNIKSVNIQALHDLTNPALRVAIFVEPHNPRLREAFPECFQDCPDLPYDSVVKAEKRALDEADRIWYTIWMTIMCDMCLQKTSVVEKKKKKGKAH